MKSIMKKVLTGTCLSLMLFTVAGTVTAYAGEFDNAYDEPEGGTRTRNDTNQNERVRQEGEEDQFHDLISPWADSVKDIYNAIH